MNTIKQIDKVLGLDLLKKESVKIPEQIKKLAAERERARKAKDFAAADEIREKINKLGFILEDTEKGVSVKKKLV